MRQKWAVPAASVGVFWNVVVNTIVPRSVAAVQNVGGACAQLRRGSSASSRARASSSACTRPQGRNSVPGGDKFGIMAEFKRMKTPA